MTEEERAWLADAVAKGLDWISPADAVQMIRERLRCDDGYAERLLRKACAEDQQVKYCNDGKRWEETWCIKKSNLVGWLDRQAPQESPRPAPEKTKHKYRNSGDAALVRRGRKLVADGMGKSEAARQLAPEAEGGDYDQRVRRLRRLF